MVLQAACFVQHFYGAASVGVGGSLIPGRNGRTLERSQRNSVLSDIIFVGHILFVVTQFSQHCGEFYLSADKGDVPVITPVVAGA